jgi:hypothetical protein
MGEATFEEQFYYKKNCEIHIFDPFNSGGYAYVPPPHITKIFVHDWGLASYDYQTSKLQGYDNKEVTMKSLITIIKELGHENRPIDILKVDIDGLEFGIFDNLTVWQEIENHNIEFHQLLIETHFVGINVGTFHWRPHHYKRYGVEMDNLIRVISQQGFAIFHKDVSTAFVPNDACEYAFVRIHINCKHYYARLRGLIS